MTFIPKESTLPGYPCGVYCYVCTCGVNTLENQLRRNSIDLDPEISNMVDENFWDLVGENIVAKKENE